MILFQQGFFKGLLLIRFMGGLFPFGIRKRSQSSRLVVLDKSFLQGNSEASLRYCVGQEWLFALPEVLMYEHFRKEDDRRTANMFKLHAIEDSVFILPGIGEMFRAEGVKLKPATTFMPAKRIAFIVERGPSGKYFELDEKSLRSVEERTAELKNEMESLVSGWNEIREMPDVKNASPNELPEVIRELSEKIRDDREDMRGFYRNHRHELFPPSEIIDEKWSYFRWIQVMLLAGLDFIKSYGINVQPSEENLMHELLDLTYLLNALLVGGLASRDGTIRRRFKFLLPTGIVLR